MKYYWMSVKNGAVDSVAYAPKGTPVAHRLLSQIDSWTTVPFHLELHSVRISSHLVVGDTCDSFFDYQPNSLAWPVLSRKIRIIIESNLTGQEGLEWKEITIKGRTQTTQYYIPTFTKKLDTLDVNHSVFAASSGMLIKGCFDHSKIGKYAVFHRPGLFWRITQLYVCEMIKKEITEAGAPEICFSEALIR